MISVNILTCPLKSRPLGPSCILVQKPHFNGKLLPFLSLSSFPTMRCTHLCFSSLLSPFCLSVSLSLYYNKLFLRRCSTWVVNECLLPPPPPPCLHGVSRPPPAAAPVQQHAHMFSLCVGYPGPASWGSPAGYIITLVPLHCYLISRSPPQHHLQAPIH